MSRYSYEIFQLENVEENRARFFMSSEHQRTLGLDPREGVYKKTYAGEIDAANAIDALDKLYYEFNVNRPIDFYGHSLSVSDVVRLNGDDWYVDPFSFYCIKERIKEAGHD